MNRQITFAVLAAFTATLTFAQGSLTPPGAPASTMRTLGQIDAAITGVSNQVKQIEAEARTPVSEAGTTITEPGSYYLTDNLEPTGGQRGITVNAGDVSLDLNGFTIDGSASTSFGISLDPRCENVVVENGTICDCRANGISGFSASNCTYRNLRVIGCSRDSTSYSALYLGSHSLIENCRVENNNGNGIYVNADSRIIGNRIVGNGVIGLRLTGTGSYVAGNIVKGNADNYNFADGNQLDLLISEIPESLDWSCSARLGRFPLWHWAWGGYYIR